MMVTPGMGNREIRERETIWLDTSYCQSPVFGNKFMNACYTILNPSIHIYIKSDHVRTNDESMS